MLVLEDRWYLGTASGVILRWQGAETKTSYICNKQKLFNKMNGYLVYSLVAFPLRSRFILICGSSAANSDVLQMVMMCSN